ncbi:MULTISPECIES: cupin domain-containing protein [Calothrix]|uniref:cupin domain-containing protein n=1 Tax=Calothrix TaxID=1186 RepID=UPI002410E342|nr:MULTISPECIES: cupin domain-containing protein [Calothrix]
MKSRGSLFRLALKRRGYQVSRYFRVFFVEAGAGTIYVDGKEYALVPGNCVAVEPGELHEVVNTGTSELILTYFGLRVEKSAG